MKDFSATFEDPSIFNVPDYVEVEVEKARFQIMLQQISSVKSNARVEIREITQYLRPMLKRSITVACPEELEAPQNLQKKTFRTKSGISRLRRKNSFLTRAKEKLRKLETENCEEETCEENSFCYEKKLLEN
jgi:hypothetical protein